MTTALSPIPSNRDMLELQASLYATKAKHPHVDCPDDAASSANANSSGSSSSSLLNDPADPAGQNGGGTTTSEQQAALAQGAAQLPTQPIDIMA